MNAELMQTALWCNGICPDIQAGIAKATELFSSGAVAAKLQQMI